MYKRNFNFSNNERFNIDNKRYLFFLQTIILKNLKKKESAFLGSGANNKQVPYG